MHEKYVRELAQRRDQIRQLEEIVEDLRDLRDYSTGRTREEHHRSLCSAVRQLAVARDALSQVETIGGLGFKGSVRWIAEEPPEIPERD
ncbi:MAG: hypothetical protein LC751_09610 [Actinobacteria bacterium]|nr:hypothetical protein [Actinomycetota bacterium]